MCRPDQVIFDGWNSFSLNWKYIVIRFYDWTADSIIATFMFLFCCVCHRCRCRCRRRHSCCCYFHVQHSALAVYQYLFNENLLLTRVELFDMRLHGCKGVNGRGNKRSGEKGERREMVDKHWACRSKDRKY